MGAEGLPVRHGENIILADDPADFAREVAALLRDPQRRACLGRAARQLVERDYGWAAAASHFERVIQSLATRTHVP
jgi:glycosyltransferase involved in cell wall biosynthesis